MGTLPQVPVFDGHNDTLLKLEIQAGSAKDRDFFEEATFDHIDLPRARKGGLAGGFFAMFVPSNPDQDFSAPFNPNDPANYAELPQNQALDFTLRLMARGHRLAAASDKSVEIVRSSKGIRECIENDRLAMLLHIEGAEAIDPDFHALEVLHAAGLRSLGPVWSRKNIFADGVPMAFPSSPDTGPGLTDTGKALIKACNDLNIMIDLSHITEKGFWDIAEMTDKPLVATHSNAHAVCPSARNLTDRQLDAIRESDGMVGVNFHVGFLRQDGRHTSATPIDDVVRHFCYLAERIGEDRVGFGSDFDGCLVPRDVKDATGLPKIIAGLADAGFNEETLRKIGHLNWIEALERSGI